MVGEACLPSNAYYPRTPDYTLCSGVHVCWSEHSDSSFVYGFMILDYGFGTMTATTHKASEIYTIQINKLSATSLDYYDKKILVEVHISFCPCTWKIVDPLNYYSILYYLLIDCIRV